MNFLFIKFYYYYRTASYNKNHFYYFNFIAISIRKIFHTLIYPLLPIIEISFVNTYDRISRLFALSAYGDKTGNYCC